LKKVHGCAAIPHGGANKLPAKSQRKGRGKMAEAAEESCPLCDLRIFSAIPALEFL